MMRETAIFGAKQLSRQNNTSYVEEPLGLMTQARSKKVTRIDKTQTEKERKTRTCGNGSDS